MEIRDLDPLLHKYRCGTHVCNAVGPIDVNGNGFAREVRELMRSATDWVCMASRTLRTELGLVIFEVQRVGRDVVKVVCSR